MPCDLNVMKIYTLNNYQEFSDLASTLVIDQIREKPNSVIGFATGNTPIGLYANLRKAFIKGEVSFAKVQTFNLDEYVGLTSNDPRSFYSYMQEHLFHHLDLSLENIHFPHVDKTDLERSVHDYNELLKQTTIDLQILGLGQNGHIGFNEPGTPFDQETFIVELTEETRLANLAFFPDLNSVPKKAITMGIKNIMSAKAILLLISGKEKKDAIMKLLKGPITTDFPASILRRHPNVTVLVNKECLKKV